MHTPIISSDYLAEPMQLDKINDFLKRAVKFTKGYNFDAFAFRGMSGALIAPLLAYKTKKTLLMVRKPKNEEFTHSRFQIEGDLSAKRYIIIDDQMCTGETVRAIVKDVSEFVPEAKCLGAIFYLRNMHNPLIRIELTSSLRLPPSLIQYQEGIC